MREFFIFNPFSNNILILIQKKVFANVTLLVAPAQVARLHHFVAPHALARQWAPQWHAWLTGAGVAEHGAHPIAPATPTRQACRTRRADATSPYKGRGPARFFSLSPLTLHVLGS
jgi:hypothetical protein